MFERCVNWITRNWDYLLKKLRNLEENEEIVDFSVASKDTSSNEAWKQDTENPTAFLSAPSPAPRRHRIKNEWFSRTIRQTTRELFDKFTKQTNAFKNEIKIWMNRVTFFRISTTLTIAKLYAWFYSLYLWRISYSDSNISM